MVFICDRRLRLIGRTRSSVAPCNAVPNHDNAGNHPVQRRRVKRTRVPPPTRLPANVHSACQYKPCFVALVLKRNIRLSFAVAILGSGAAFCQPSRSTDSAFWNPSPGAALVSRAGLRPYHYGGLRRCRARNVVAPGQYSKWFLGDNRSFYRGTFRPETALTMPARSVFGGRPTVSPAAVIKASMSPLWPCPASTTSAPPRLSRRSACGISAR